jgi:hypothetical protein
VKGRERLNSRYPKKSATVYAENDYNGFDIL